MWRTADPVSGRSQAYEEMALRDLQELATRTPGMCRQKRVGKKWVNMKKEELAEAFRAFDAKKRAQPLAGSGWEEMSVRALRDLADKTPGITNRKKVGKKWVYKEKEELVEEFKELKAKKSAQPLAGPKTDLDKRLAQKARQTREEYKVKKRRREMAQECKVKKRKRENAPTAKRHRLTRLWAGAQRAAKRAAQRTEPYKEKKRTRENAPEAQVKRKQRKLFLFWKDCFRRWAWLRRLRECRLSPMGKSEVGGVSAL